MSRVKTVKSKGRSCRGRCGATLLELVVVIGLTSLVLATVTTTLHSIYRSERAVRDELEGGVNLARLDATFRSDVHQASEAKLVQPNADPSRIARAFLVGKDWQIEYWVQKGGRIHRTKEVAGEVVHRDSFLVGDEVQVEWNLPGEDAPQLVSMRIRDQSSGREWVITAALGLRQFAFHLQEPLNR